ncbi:MAG: heme ABC transporter permease CcmB, partial [Chloroflexaceae bacterium]|nr:heme ABC transporter permease CcmB [Chloroflexaceae bacterium]
MRVVLAATWAVLRKDIQSELRTRYAFNALLLFAASTAVAVSLGVGFIGLQRDPQTIVIQSALLWIALLFAALNGLSRSFVQEEERRTTLALRLAAPPTAVYLGKLVFNLLLLLVLDTVTTLLFLVFLRVEIANPLMFVVVLALARQPDHRATL